MGITRIVCGLVVVACALLNIAVIADINVAGQGVLIFVGCVIACWGIDSRRYQRYLEQEDDRR
jgi:hypothetical protein